MLVTHNREKLVNAIVYFAANTNHCGKTKLFKLLYLVDFEHYRQTGRSVTGLPYAAWKEGPVPHVLYKEWKDPKPDLAAAVTIRHIPLKWFTRQEVSPKVDFVADYFSRRELDVMKALAEKYRDHYAEDMVDVTHKEFGPWHQVWDEGKGRSRSIPYELAVTREDAHRGAILQAASDYEGLIRQQGQR